MAEAFGQRAGGGVGAGVGPSAQAEACVRGPAQQRPPVPALGAGLRAVQMALALGLLAAYANVATIDPLGFSYDLSLARGVFQSVSCVLGIWMIQRRFAMARVFCPACAAANLALMLVDLVPLGAAGEMAAAIGQAAALALAAVHALLWLAVGLYLGLSREARRVLVVLPSSVGKSGVCSANPSISGASNPRAGGSGADALTGGDTNADGPSASGFNTGNPGADAPRAGGSALPLRERLRTWPFWRDVAIYFIIFSFVGHWAEIAFCLLIRAGVFMGSYDPANHMLWDQWLYPFSAEGIALALIVLLLHPFKEWLLRRLDGCVVLAFPLSFLANAAVCTSIDFTLGITCNASYELWDYRELPFNFMGQIVLQNSVVYSVAATLVVWLVYPVMDRAMGRLPRWLADALFWGLAAAYGFLALLHFLYLGPDGWVLG